MKEEINKLLKSNLTNYEIWKGSGVASSKISDLRHGKALVDNISLKNAERLYRYYQEKFENTDSVQKCIDEARYSTVAHLLTFTLGFNHSNVDQYIIEFSIRRNDMLDIIELEEIEFIDEDSNSWNSAARKIWFGEN